MSYAIVLVGTVKDDITKAATHYKSINPLLAKQFLFRIREAKAYIAKSPLGFQIKYKEIRTLLLKQFPYHIHYLIDNKHMQIIILAVIHAYKNPEDFSYRQE
jgi:plasmid stabilization system protein ParE